MLTALANNDLDSNFCIESSAGPFCTLQKRQFWPLLFKGKWDKSGIHTHSFERKKLFVKKTTRAARVSIATPGCEITGSIAVQFPPAPGRSAIGRSIALSRSNASRKHYTFES